MLKINSSQLSQINLSVHDVAVYARERGWRQIPHPNERLLVFEGPPDDEGNTIVLILPSRDDFGDTLLRLTEAVNLLADVENCSPDIVLKNIQGVSLLYQGFKILVGNAHPTH